MYDKERFEYAIENNKQIRELYNHYINNRIYISVDGSSPVKEIMDKVMPQVEEICRKSKQKVVSSKDTIRAIRFFFRWEPQYYILKDALRSSCIVLYKDFERQDGTITRYFDGTMPHTEYFNRIR